MGRPFADSSGFTDLARIHKCHEINAYHASNGFEGPRVYDPAGPQRDAAPPEGYKVGGVSYDELLDDLLDAHPPEEFFLEHLRRLKREPRRPWSEIKKELNL